MGRSFLRDSLGETARAESPPELREAYFFFRLVFFAFFAFAFFAFFAMVPSSFAGAAAREGRLHPIQG
jgi:hypothetical protein